MWISSDIEWYCKISKLTTRRNKMKTEIRLARAIKKLPEFLVNRQENDYETTKQQPVLKGSYTECGTTYLATIHPSQGDDIQGAYDITQVGRDDYEYRYLCEVMENWAKKYGFRWECIVNDGFYGLVDEEVA